MLDQFMKERSHWNDNLYYKFFSQWTSAWAYSISSWRKEAIQMKHFSCNFIKQRKSEGSYWKVQKVITLTKIPYKLGLNVECTFGWRSRVPWPILANYAAITIRISGAWSSLCRPWTLCHPSRASQFYIGSPWHCVGLQGRRNQGSEGGSPSPRFWQIS